MDSDKELQLQKIAYVLSQLNLTSDAMELYQEIYLMAQEEAWLNKIMLQKKLLWTKSKVKKSLDELSSKGLLNQNLSVKGLDLISPQPKEALQKILNQKIQGIELAVKNLDSITLPQVGLEIDR